MATDSYKKSVFVLGAGYIGKSLIDELLKSDFHVTALVRRPAQAEELAALSVSTVMGSLDDLNLITAQSSVSDVVFHTASADHAPSALAILKGVQQRAERGQQAIYIHNSGGGVLDDGAAGRWKSEKVYKDDSREDMDTLPNSNPHRHVDLAILSRQKEIGVGAKIAIMIAPLIYGCKSS
jgi:putative NADH-flavin reductase